MKYIVYLVVVFCLYYTATHLYERGKDFYWFYNNSASAWTEGACPAHPSWRFNFVRAEVEFLVVKNDPNCRAWGDD